MGTEEGRALGFGFELKMGGERFFIIVHWIFYIMVTTTSTTTTTKNKENLFIGSRKSPSHWLRSNSVEKRIIGNWLLRCHGQQSIGLLKNQLEYPESSRRIMK